MLSTVRHIRFSVWEVCLIAGCVALIAWSAARSFAPPRPAWTIDPQWEQEFATRYGPERFSAGLEEYLVREYFGDARKGVYLDVGAFRPVAGNNSYRLERDFGWTGLALDANPAVIAEWQALRPKARFVQAFITDTDSGEEILHVDAVGAGASSGDRRFTEQFGAIAESVSVKRRTLNSLLQQHQISQIDFVSMDIELGEPAALKGFDLRHYRPRLLCIEAHPPTREWLLQYFAERQYVLIGRFLAADPMNYWFRPLEHTPAAFRASLTLLPTGSPAPGMLVK